MVQKCPKCSSVCDSGSKFCEKCGHSLASTNKPTPQNGKSNKKLFKAIAFLGVLGVLAATVTYMLNANALKGEWLVYQDGIEYLKVSIPNKEEFVFSYLDEEVDAEIDVYYEFNNPQSKNEPYALSQPLRAEMTIPIASLNEEVGSEYFSELGFIVETHNDQYVMHTEKPEALAYVSDSEQKIYFYEVNDTIEIIYSQDDEVDFEVALPTHKRPEEAEYVSLFEEVLDELKASEIDHSSSAKEILVEIKETAPDSKLLAAYSKLNERNEAFLAAVKNKDKAQLQEISAEIAELPLSKLGGLYQHYLDNTDILLNRISQAEAFDQAVANAQTSFDNGEMEEAVGHLSIDGDIAETVESYYPESFKVFETLIEKIDGEKYGFITIDDFYGYWTSYPSYTSESETMGKPVFYLSETLAITAINHGEMSVSAVLSSNVNKNVATITNQPANSGMMYSEEEKNLGEWTYDIFLEKNEEGKTLTFSTNPDLTFYYQENEGTNSAIYDMFEEKGNAIYNAYLTEQSDKALLETNPASYLIGKTIKETTADSTILYDFREKSPSSNHNGIGELWYSRSTTNEPDDVQSRGIQFAIHDITYQDNIIRVEATEFINDTLDIPIYFEYVYLGDNYLGVYNSESEQMTATVTIE
ncbi:zinc ribbon domain-containing protein [Jeotgalibaca ciconiae]|uniref:Uncharacterized protein n=1 Tax=Jeotgalibaca ciconiae TaxID=2496265 RepID=A0A3Q9BN27_9LACT|nr:zinc ribbon domain-containing protein [Jeotgalibaca ciconiae]AZP04892.1 hypothetical protein EJN90_09700 [Jeotgalibaca ciconiae]